MKRLGSFAYDFNSSYRFEIYFKALMRVPEDQSSPIVKYSITLVRHPSNLYFPKLNH